MIVQVGVQNVNNFHKIVHLEFQTMDTVQNESIGWIYLFVGFKRSGAQSVSLSTQMKINIENACDRHLYTVEATFRSKANVKPKLQKSSIRESMREESNQQ